MRLTLLLIVMVLNYSANAEKNNYGLSKEKVNQSEINWLLDRHNIQEFRGGTTDGLDPDIDLNTSDYFQKLQKDFL